MVIVVVAALKVSKLCVRNFSRFSTLSVRSYTTVVFEKSSLKLSFFKSIKSKSSRAGIFFPKPGRNFSQKMTSDVAGAGDRDKCIFCKIVDGKEGNEIFYQDEEFVVFQDIKPAAKHHLLVVPREHIRDSKSLTPAQLPLAKRLVEIGKQTLLSQMKKHSPELECLPTDLKILMGYHWPPFHSIAHLHLHVIAPADQMSFIGRTIFRPNSFWFVTPEYIHDRLEKMAATENANS